VTWADLRALLGIPEVSTTDPEELRDLAGDRPEDLTPGDWERLFVLNVEGPPSRRPEPNPVGEGSAPRPWRVRGTYKP
jgi:hypothetical protein